jgi:aspartate kinase
MEENHMQNHLISGILFNGKAALIIIHGLRKTPGIEGQILGLVSKANIDVDMIAESPSDEDKMNFTFTIEQKDHHKALPLIQKFGTLQPQVSVTSYTNVAKLSLVGIGMRSHTGVTYHMFKALGEKEIHIRMITTSETKISIIIDEENVELAIAALHEEFEIDRGNKVKQMVFMEI